MLHISCNIGTRDLPDMYALGLWAYISGKSLVPMLQLLYVLPVKILKIMKLCCDSIELMQGVYPS